MQNSTQVLKLTQFIIREKDLKKKKNEEEEK